MPSVEEFNLLPDEAARNALAQCCSSGRWADAVVAGRPYRDVRALLDASDAAVAGLAERDLAEALTGHPRLGDRRVISGSEAWTEGRPVGQSRTAGGSRPSGSGERAVSSRADTVDWSRQEQAGVARADGALQQQLAEGNAEYERRFGHIYLAYATGRSAAELLAFLRERLGNDQAAEWRVVAGELTKINQIRLRKLVGQVADGGTT